MLYLGKSHGKFINGGHSAVLSIHCAGYHTRKCHKILSVAVKIKHPWWVAQALGIDRHKRMFSTLNCEILFIHSEIWAHTYIYLFHEWKYGVCFFLLFFNHFSKRAKNTNTMFAMCIFSLMSWVCVQTSKNGWETLLTRIKTSRTNILFFLAESKRVENVLDCVPHRWETVRQWEGENNAWALSKSVSIGTKIVMYLMVKPRKLDNERNFNENGMKMKKEEEAVEAEHNDEIKFSLFSRIENS